MNNLAEVLKALRELNFILANRAPELALYYNMDFKPRQISEEVPHLVGLHLNAQLQLSFIIWCTVPEEDPTPEVINTTGTANSHHHY